MSNSFWRRTPPALFPVCLGLIGLGYVWLSASETLGAPRLIGEMITAAGAAAAVFCMICYLAKLAHRPAVLLMDLDPAPGRAAVSAGSMCLMMTAAGVARVTGEVDVMRLIWGAGLAFHGLFAIAVIIAIWRSGLRNFRVTPVLLLPFVGFIVGPFGAVEVGLKPFAHYIFWYCLPGFVMIVALSAPRFLIWPTPKPQRAAAAILLAPTSLFASVALLLNMGAIFDVLFIAACVICAALIFSIRWLCAGGWTPLWGAFTFPSAAFAGALLGAATRYGEMWIYVTWAGLIAATAIVLPLFFMTFQAWAQGRLAPATGAAAAK